MKRRRSDGAFDGVAQASEEAVAQRVDAFLTLGQEVAHVDHDQVPDVLVYTLLGDQCFRPDEEDEGVGVGDELVEPAFAPACTRAAQEIRRDGPQAAPVHLWISKLVSPSVLSVHDRSI